MASDALSPRSSSIRESRRRSSVSISQLQQLHAQRASSRSSGRGANGDDSNGRASRNRAAAAGGAGAGAGSDMPRRQSRGAMERLKRRSQRTRRFTFSGNSIEAFRHQVDRPTTALCVRCLLTGHKGQTDTMVVHTHRTRWDCLNAPIEGKHHAKRSALIAARCASPWMRHGTRAWL